MYDSMHPKANKRYRKPRPVPPHCMFLLVNGYCMEHAGHGTFGDFCEPHAERLAEIRADLQVDLAATSRHYRNGKWVKKRTGAPSTCCNPYCGKPRTPPAAFCEDCLEAGHTEEAA